MLLVISGFEIRTSNRSKLFWVLCQQPRWLSIIAHNFKSLVNMICTRSGDLRFPSVSFVPCFTQLFCSWCYFFYQLFQVWLQDLIPDVTSIAQNVETGLRMISSSPEVRVFLSLWIPTELRRRLLGGTAGISLAARLTENPAFSVLVIEAGPAPDSINQYEAVPGLDFFLEGMLPVHPIIYDSHFPFS